MASYYVRPDGNDGNDGSADDAAHAFLTPDFAFRSGVPLTAGPHTLFIKAGTYTINNVGTTGSFKWGRAYGTLLTITTTSGLQDVIFQNATSADTYLMQNTATATNMSFNNLTFTPISGTLYCWLYKNLSQCTNVSFTNCVFNAPISSGGGLWAIISAGGNGALTSDISFTNCSVVKGTGTTGGAINVTTGTGPQVLAWNMTNCTVTSTAAGVNLDGSSFTATIQGGNYSTSGTATVALILGTDTTGAGKGGTGTVRGATISATASHAFEIGDLAIGVIATGNTITGGDYGVVLKNTGANNIFANNKVTAGTLGGILLKGFPNSQCIQNTVYASAAPAFKNWDSGAPAGNFINTNTIVRGNRIIITGTGTAWDHAQTNGAGTQVDGSGNITDYNIYDIRAGSYGTVNAQAAIASLVNLRSAWNLQTPDTGNDLHSLDASSQTLEQVKYSSTGSWVYALITNSVTGQIWNRSAVETPASANYGLYAIPAVEDPSGGYFYNLPFPLMAPAAKYDVSFYVRSGNVSAGSDVQVGSTLSVIWNGTTSIYQTGDSFTRLGAPNGASVSADVLALNTLDTNNQTKLTNLLAGLLPFVGSAVVDTGTPAATTTAFQTNLSSSVDNFYKGMVVEFTSGALTGQSGHILSYVGSTKVATLVSALTAAPLNGVLFSMSLGSRKLVDMLNAIGTDSRVKVSADTHTSGETVAAVTGAVGSVTAAVTAGTVSDKTGYSLSVTPPTSAAIATAVATAILTTPANKLTTDGSGFVTLTAAEHTAIAADFLGAVVFGTVTVKQVLGTAFGVLSNDLNRTWNATTHTATVVAYAVTAGNAADHTKPMVTQTTVYDSTNTQVVSRSTTFANLP